MPLDRTRTLTQVYLALAGHAPALAAAYAAKDGDAAADAATDRPVAWVSAEGVGVAPAIPTFGDRRAFGHSIIGVAVFDHSALHAEAVGRTWSQGRLLAWLADS